MKPNRLVTPRQTRNHRPTPPFRREPSVSVHRLSEFGITNFVRPTSALKAQYSDKIYIGSTRARSPATNIISSIWHRKKVWD